MACYLRRFFYGGMTTTHRSESFNSLCNHYVGPKTTLMQFVTQYGAIVAARRLATVKANYDRKVISSTTTGHFSPLLAHTHATYSRCAFEKLKKVNIMLRTSSAETQSFFFYICSSSLLHHLLRTIIDFATFASKYHVTYVIRRDAVLALVYLLVLPVALIVRLRRGGFGAKS